jgi:hypothetical protein
MNGIHQVSHPQQGDNLFLLAAQSQAAASEFDLGLSKGRYMCLNAWRNISSHPILRDSLTVFGETPQPMNQLKFAEYTTFPDHEPNTRPEVPDPADEVAERLTDVVRLVPS